MNKVTDKNLMFGLKSFHLQTIEHEASHPQKTHINFVPFARFTDPSHLYIHPKLIHTKKLLEWAYGYRLHKHNGNRHKRRTPSAGGLYPNEVMVLIFLENSWKLLYYSFEQNDFFLVKEINKKDESYYDLSDRHEIKLFFISVLWKTVQKYGVRAFRYSLLDAGFIGAHIQRMYRKVAEQKEINLNIGYRKVNELIRLKKGEEVMYSISIHHEFEIPEEPKIPADLNIQVNYEMDDRMPCLSTNMIRVIDVSDKALKCKGEILPLQRQFFYSFANCFTDIENRLSANGFKDEPVHMDYYAKIKTGFSNCALQVKKVFGLKVHVACLISKIVDKENVLELVYTGSDHSSTKKINNLRSRIREACQKQEIMYNAAFTFVLFVIPNEIEDWSYFNYMKSVLASSFICSELYFLAMHNKISTTTIGGFSERQILELLDEKEILPLVVQAFGIENKKEIKADALITQ